MSDFTPLMPHGSIEEVFDGVFFVTGTTRPKFMDLDWQFSRNMTIVRDGDALTLINTVRLDDEGLTKLDALGRVANVVKLGQFHGIDDAFYLDRYHAKQWALEGAKHFAGHGTDKVLKPGGEAPFAGCTAFVYETSDHPEGLLRIDRAGGILVACDSLQNWDAADEYFDEPSKARMTEAGFIRPANIGPGWQRSCNPEASDFKRVAALEFRHLLPAHGRPLVDDAHAQLVATFEKAYDI